LSQYFVEEKARKSSYSGWTH